MNKQLLLQFLKKWKCIEHVERNELKKMPLKEKINKTTSAMKLGFELGYTPDRTTLQEIKDVRDRWIFLKKSLNG